MVNYWIWEEGSCDNGENGGCGGFLFAVVDFFSLQGNGSEQLLLAKLVMSQVCMSGQTDR